ncbi:MAG TPA: S41 family peptidase, partial [Armatimonadota bacterium]|nr:S41 family peptidase [Armatimonadota bacterium]
MLHLSPITKSVGWAVAAACAGSLVMAAAGAASVARTSKMAAQAQAPEQRARDYTVSPDVRARVVEEILQQLRDRYVFPEVAEKMAASIRERTARKEYDGITSGNELARKLTEDLQAVSHDKHLRVRCSPEPLPQGPQEPGPNERAEMRAGMLKANGGFRKAERLPGNIGYIDLRGFMAADVAAEPAAAAMNLLANTDALIIDLRRNGGGDPAMVALLCSYLFDEKPVHLNSLHWRTPEGEHVDKFYTLASVPGKRYLGRPVYLLTSSRTFSAAEEFTYNLKNLKRATLVGETTGGGANPGGVLRIGEHFGVFIPMG